MDPHLPENSAASRAFVDWFRHSSPYINAFRGRTFVIGFGGEAVADGDFPHLVHDLALLHSLGVRLVLVHGARPQIDARLAESGIPSTQADGLRITDDDALPAVTQATGAVRAEVEARLSMGLANSPMAGLAIRVLSGNFITARPLGVRNGVDFRHTGEVRRVDTAALRTALTDEALVLLGPLGYSPTGEIFNLGAEEVAARAATALGADKLILLAEPGSLPRRDGRLLDELDPDEAAALAGTDAMGRTLGHAIHACRHGVPRVHLLERDREGALLLELFTREGIGTLISRQRLEGTRTAGINDVGGILELIAPLEAEGVLVRRSREQLETEIDRFIVVERDGAIIACAALYPFLDDAMGELACLAVAPDYQGAGRGDALLTLVERSAREQGIEGLFVLTTRTAHWFQERGFEPAALDDLPMARQALYNYQRNARVFVKKPT
ncbi:MAG: amino-acid N-acetyltransferase [Pseudomonadota bacterium]